MITEIQAAFKKTVEVKLWMYMAMWLVIIIGFISDIIS